MAPLLEAISPREEQVLALLAAGHGLREIGLRLGMSWRTAKTHRDNARRKLGATNQTHAVAIFVSARSRS